MAKWSGFRSRFRLAILIKDESGAHQWKPRFVEGRCIIDGKLDSRSFINMNKIERSDDGWKLLMEFTQSESLRKHALSVEACMRAYARKLNGDEAKWASVGLIHDFDYEKYPSAEEHPYKGNEILKDRGYPGDIRRAIMSHADYTGVTRDSQMEKALFACDELAGFITATALIKPNKSLAEVDAKSVRKRMKDKAFARSVSREDIINGAAGLGVDLDEHITFCIEAMKSIAAELGLEGSRS
jgi:putative nucleotidyltransferase with HDIG domain